MNHLSPRKVVGLVFLASATIGAAGSALLLYNLHNSGDAVGALGSSVWGLLGIRLMSSTVFLVAGVFMLRKGGSL